MRSFLIAALALTVGILLARGWWSKAPAPDPVQVIVTEVKTHALIGFSALELASFRLGNNSFLKYAMELARNHHEKWDGSGYPDGLSGEEIPLSARIMAVADVYDALISKRTYKPAFSHERAVALIREARGTHLDPDIVDVFLEFNEEFRSIAAEYADFQEGQAV